MIIKYYPSILSFEGKDLSLSGKCIRVLVGLDLVDQLYFESEEVAEGAWLYIFSRYQSNYNTVDLDEFVKCSDATSKIC